MTESEQALQWERDIKDCRELFNEVFLQIEMHYRGKGLPDTMLMVESNLAWLIGESEEAENRLHTYAIVAKGDEDLGKLFTIDPYKVYPDDISPRTDDSEGSNRDND